MDIIRSIPATACAQGPLVDRSSPPTVRGYERTVKHHRLTITVGSRRHQFEFERVRERYGVAMSGNDRGRGEMRALPGRLLLGAATVGLFLAYVALLPAPAPATRYSAVLAIPARPAELLPVRHVRRLAHVRSAAGRDAGLDARPPAGSDDIAAAMVSPLASPSLDGSIGSPDASPDIQDMPAGIGERTLAVLGPQRQVNGKSCRDVQLFSRDAAGTVSVRPSVQCGGKGQARGHGIDTATSPK